MYKANAGEGAELDPVGGEDSGNEETDHANDRETDAEVVAEIISSSIHLDPSGLTLTPEQQSRAEVTKELRPFSSFFGSSRGWG